ncbi:MAG TPA: hypothetical protein VG898_05735, partial [Solirubrobacterales bacterium]|nr:hypothetical protein [Solirubrobacterales bacterium]
MFVYRSANVKFRLDRPSARRNHRAEGLESTQVKPSGHPAFVADYFTERPFTAVVKTPNPKRGMNGVARPFALVVFVV